LNDRVLPSKRGSEKVKVNLNHISVQSSQLNATNERGFPFVMLRDTCLDLYILPPESRVLQQTMLDIED